MAQASNSSLLIKASEPHLCKALYHIKHYKIRRNVCNHNMAFGHFPMLRLAQYMSCILSHIVIYLSVILHGNNSNGLHQCTLTSLSDLLTNQHHTDQNHPHKPLLAVLLWQLQPRHFDRSPQRCCRSRCIYWSWDDNERQHLEKRRNKVSLVKVVALR